MNQPTIQQAKDLAYQLRAKAVGDGGYAATSYGMTREQCRAAGKVVEGIGDVIETGLLEIPEALR